MQGKKATKVASTSALNTTKAFKRRCVSKYDSCTPLKASRDVIVQRWVFSMIREDQVILSLEQE